MRAQSVHPIRIVSSDASSVVLDFTLTGLREGIGPDGLPALAFDGSTSPHSHDHETPVGGEDSSTLQLPHITAALGLPPDSTPTATVVTSDTERIPIERFPFLAAGGRYREQELVTASVSGYVRDQYIGRVVIRPVAFAGASLLVTTRCRVRVTFSSVPAAPSFGRSPLPRSEAFEGLYKDLLTNYEQARSWRKGRARVRTAPSATSAANSRIRLRVDETSLYRVGPADLRILGVTPEEIDPTTFRLEYRGDEVGIDVIGGEDGVFDGSDRIVFFGEHIGHSRFTTENAYLLSWGGETGVRPAVKDGTPAGVDVQSPEAFRGADYFETDRMHAELIQVVDERADHYFHTQFTGGTRDRRQWDKTLFKTFPTEANHIPRSARLRIGFQGGRPASFPHRMQVLMNGQELLDTKWTGQTQHFRDVTFKQDFMAPEVSLRFVNLDNNDTANDKGDLPESRVDVYLDWYELDYWREFRHTTRGVLISSSIYPSLQAGPVRYQLTGYPTGQVFAYELGDAGIIGKFANVRTLRGGDGRLTVTFQDVHSVPTRYMVSGNADLRRPVGIDLAPDSGLQSPSTEVDYLIITHSDFLDAIQPLADHRAAEGHKVKVVDIESVYNDFSRGVFSPFAIQNLLRYAYQVWQTPPEYVLLVGDAHYDYKDGDIRIYAESGIIRENYPNYVPTIHAWGGTASGETAMDHRFVTIEGDDPLPDMFIGRLPVQLPSEVRGIVRKIIAYETEPEIGLWQTRMTQVADNDLSKPGDQIFQASREGLIKTVIPPAYDVQKIYLKEIGSSGATKVQIKDAITEGTLVLEYAGHGGRGIWADEDILRLWDITNLRNGRRQPLLVATTCQMNFFDQ
ncbi:MAG: C25 family cysteine peptidase, partial [Candidatus Poribacteria bacterium]